MFESELMPVAIVGSAFYLPCGVGDYSKLWSVLQEKRSLISVFEPDSLIHQRWTASPYFHPNPGEAGKTYSFNAGLVREVEHFDAEFFGITPREARHLDPRQRQLLELSWRALEQAGIRPESLRGSDCAVYAGVSGNDYSLPYCNDPSVIGPYTMTGNACSIAANRLSHFYGLTGPSVAVDTACSSSLIALHHACQAIRQKEVTSAIVATSSLHLHPLNFVGFAKAHMLSTLGQCRPFDADADGYVRSEGSIVLYVKSLDEAERAGDPVQAVILHSGINSDGQTSSLPVPSAHAQAALMSKVLEQAGVSVDDLDYFEAHGTGTPIGDPIEAHAIGQAIAKARKHPLPIGSIKGNIGHLEVASGLASLLKVIVSLQQGAIPPTINCRTVNPHIDLDELNLSIVQQPLNLKRKERPWVVGVNSFGFGGSNASMLLAAYRQRAVSYCRRANHTETVANAPCPPLVISAQNKHALSELTVAYKALLESGKDYYSVAYNAVKRRQLLRHGMLLFADESHTQLLNLQRISNEGSELLDVVKADKIADDAPVTLIYTGNGCQWRGMGRELLRLAWCRELLQQIDALFAELQSKKTDMPFSLIDAIESDTEYTDTRITQPVLFALQVLISQYLIRHGLIVDAVIGHSLGEVAAAWVAGHLNLTQACRIVYARSQAQSLTKGLGAMAAMALDRDEAYALFGQLNLPLEVVGYNSHRHIAVAGDSESMRQLIRHCDSKAIYCHRLEVDHAFHSSQMDTVKQEFEFLLGGLNPTAKPGSSIDMISTVTGNLILPEQLNDEYWWLNLRKPVDFAQAVEVALDGGAQLFIEIGAHPQLQAYVNTAFRHKHLKGLVLSSLRRDCEQHYSLKICLYHAFLSGARFDTDRWFPHEAPHLSLPAYPWQRQAFYHRHSQESADYTRLPQSHPLLGTRIHPEVNLWQNHLDTRLFPYLADHCVDGVSVMPAAGFVEMVLAVSQAMDGVGPLTIRDLSIEKPMLLERDHALELRVTCHQTSNFKKVVIKSRPRHQQLDWQTHVKAILNHYPVDAKQSALPVLSAPCFSVTRQQIYQFAASIGLNYGPCFQAIDNIQATDSQAQADFVCPAGVDLTESVLHPVMLDASLQLAIAIYLVSNERCHEHALLPVRFGRIQVWGNLCQVKRLKINFLRRNHRQAVGQVFLADAQDKALARLDECYFQAVNLHQRQALQCLEWVVKPQLPHEFEAFSYQKLLEIAAKHDFTRCDHDLSQMLIVNADAKEGFGSIRFDQALWRQSLFKLPGQVALLSLIGQRAMQSSIDAAGDLLETSDSIWREVLTNQHAVVSVLRRILSLWQRHRPFRVLLLSSSSLVESVLGLLSDNRVEVTVLGTQTSMEFSQYSKYYPHLMVLKSDDLSLNLVEGKQFDILIASSCCGKDDFYRWHQQFETCLAPGGILMLNQYRESALTRFLSDANFSSVDKVTRFLEESSWLVAEPIKNEHAYLLMAQTSRQGVKKEASTYYDYRANPEKKSYLIFSDGNCEPLYQALKPRAARLEAIVLEQGIDLKEGVSRHYIWQDDWQLVVVLGESRTSQDFNYTQIMQRLIGLQELVGVVDSLKVNHQISWSVVTFDACLLPGQVVQAEQTMIASFVRTLANEFASMKFKLIDVAKGLRSSSERIATELAEFSQQEQDILLCADGRKSLHLMPESMKQDPSYSKNARLDYQDPTNSDKLNRRYVWRKISAKPLGKEQIKVTTKACGLNFRDLMLSLRLIPDEAVERGFFGPRLGLEFAGVVSELGSEVTEFKLGDKVFGFASNALASEVITGRHQVMHIPDAWSFEQAATVPIAFFTAYYCLVHLAQIQAGETVLIHSAAGGVGIACIQVAMALGAKVVATAGCEKKRNFLHLMGVSNVYDSRGLNFVEPLEADLGGVDVVVNSLAYDAIEASLQLLQPFGRFLELGKRDFYQNSSVHCYPLRNNVQYFAVDADQLIRHKPKLCHRLFEQLKQLFDDAKVHPLPYQSFDAPSVEAAMKTMQQARHIGKLILTFDDAFRVPVYEESKRELEFAPEGAYLVVGGLSGFGLQTAAWLAEKGVRHLILLSKSGKSDDPGLLARIKDKCVSLCVKACDVSDYDRLSSVFSEIKHRLKGIIHAAAVYDDCFINDLTPKRLDDVLAVKVKGSWNLHRLSLDLDLEHFIVYSSAATFFGNPGQASYVAANAFIEALINNRHAQNLVGTAIAWGAVDTGFIRRNDRLRKFLSRMGIKPVSIEQALNQLHSSMLRPHPPAAALAINWPSLAASLPTFSHSRFDYLQRLIPDWAYRTDFDDIHRMLEGKSDEEREELIAQALVEEVSQILCLPLKKIDRNQSLLSIGLDSLMGYELVQSIEQRFNVKVPLMTFSQSPSIRNVACKVAQLIKA